MQPSVTKIQTIKFSFQAETKGVTYPKYANKMSVVL